MERMKLEEVAPEVYRVLLGLEQAVQASGIDKKLLHLIKLRASQINSCAFCMAMHTKEAIRDGDHPDRVALLSGWRETDLFTPKEQAALEWTEAVTSLNNSHIGDDLYELSGEVDKLATWANGAEVTAADVEALVAPRAESPPWNLTDAWGARDVGVVLREAEKMLDRTGDPVSRTIPRLVGQLTRHVQRARAAHRLEEQGLSPQDAATKLGLKPYPAQKLFAQVRNFSGAELDDALIRLAELDHALKGGSRLANELELERALVDITEPRGVVKDAA